MKQSKQPVASDPKPTEVMGCTLFAVSGAATALFGLMALGSAMPEVARIGFAISAFALVAAIVLTSFLGFIAHLRSRDDEEEGWTLRGENLTKVGEGMYGVKRMFAEPDARYRKRLMAVLRAQHKDSPPS